MNTERITKRLTVKRTALTTATAQLRDERDARTENEKRITDYIQAQTIIQSISKEIQTAAHKKITAVVNKCLEVIFDDPYEFRLIFEEKRGKTEARAAFVRGGHELDPLTAAGGGTVDVAAFALRLASIVLATPAPRKLMVLDEPFRFVSKEYAGRVRKLLELLAEELDVQFIMVTHNRRLVCGRVIDLGEDG